MSVDHAVLPVLPDVCLHRPDQPDVFPFGRISAAECSLMLRLLALLLLSGEGG